MHSLPFVNPFYFFFYCVFVCVCFSVRSAVQLKYIEAVQNDLARAHELVCYLRLLVIMYYVVLSLLFYFSLFFRQLHVLIVTECKNKVDVYKRQLDRLDKTLEFVHNCIVIL